MFTVWVTGLSDGTARLPRMSAGGSPADTIVRMAVVAGVRCTSVPPGMVILVIDRVGLEPEPKAEATTPATTMNTAIPSTTIAGPRRDMGWKERLSGSTACASSASPSSACARSGGGASLRCWP